MHRREIRGLFLLLGAEPHCEWLPDEVARDERGLRAHRPRRAQGTAWPDGLPPANLATTVPGIFAAGDIRAGSMKRVASASGEGASVVSLVHDWWPDSTDTVLTCDSTQRLTRVRTTRSTFIQPIS